MNYTSALVPIFASLVGGGLVAAVIFASKTLIEALVKRENDRSTEDYKFSIRLREQAALVAELLAEWTDRPKDRKRLNELAFKAGLWLPPDAVRELTRTLIHAPDGKNVHEILLMVRAVLHGRKEKLVAEDMVYFPKNADDGGAPALNPEGPEARPQLKS